ncbi:MAG: sigma-54-dependent Fis family transcriptional regulator [Planctomycetes bacterium]|nr:sigma-54-dependent Fis family transcriptional regulator [Planctomycetota bacterium]MCP4771043.1 sigma-54-dependent Fis family transcriptional regulator [Planctomycetota bacterium]MCP4861761.1 sigma-54-dependent Fis family transcriptional regulator [Planctomycetota bacterium]
MSIPMHDFDISQLRVLVVDDEADIRLGLTRLLESLGIEAEQAADGREALAAFTDGEWDLVLTDLMMPGMTGAELLVEIKKEHPQTAVVLLTGFGSIQVAVQCLQDGASHFLTKPFDNQDVLSIIQRLGCQLLARRQPREVGVAMVAEDPATQRMLDLVRQVAPRPVPVLVEGESGTGKEVVARALHRWSSVSEGKFLAVNCAAVSDTLLESELFGHVRGSFTGADRDRSGVFAEVQGGTVFLDEVASMSPAFQGKLLRVLQEKVVRPVGADRDVRVDFRLIAATNRDLEALVAKGEFREDLYFRLRVVPVYIPPLRERQHDILPLALHFLLRETKVCLGPDAQPPELDAETIHRLMQHSWPGNVRELENCIMRAMIVGGGERILSHHLGLDEKGWQREEQSAATVVQASPAQVGAIESDDYAEAKRQTVERFQREFVERALEHSQGNVSQAALNCGLTRAAFQKILRQLGVDRGSFS